MTLAKQYVDELSVNESEPCGLNFLQNTLGFKMRGKRYLKKKNMFGVFLNLNHLKNSLRCLLNPKSSFAPTIWQCQSGSSDELKPNFNFLHMW